MPLVDISNFDHGNMVKCDLKASLCADTAYNSKLLPGCCWAGFEAKLASVGNDFG